MFTPSTIEIIDPNLTLENGNRVFTTLEGENPGGSIKDHMVRGEIEDLFKKKLLKVGDVISEVSSGSTAISLAHYCSQFGLKCVLFIPNTASWKLVAELQDLGAEIHTAELSSIYSLYSSYIAQEPSVYSFNQLFDETKQRHYFNFGVQIFRSIGPVNTIIGAVGTGHSLLGTAKGLGAPLVVSAEPETHLKISGVRNLEFERYGEKDTCGPSQFDRRVIVDEKEIPTTQIILTDHGSVQITPSFQLVLGAIRIFLRDKKNFRVFALGASLKRLPAAVKAA